MTIANVLQGNVAGLPQALRSAQEAIHLPEVQAMLHRLSEYNLGIFMPHMHDDHTGEFLPLLDGITQVESSLEVSFQRTQKIANQADRFLPVGWVWRAGASTTSAVCEMVRDDTADDMQGYPKHKMIGK
jgi:hypothetical protein